MDPLPQSLEVNLAKGNFSLMSVLLEDVRTAHCMERFKHSLTDKLIEDYDLFRLALPHHDEMQAYVGSIVRQEACDRVALRTLRVLEAGAGTGITTRQLLDAHSKVRVTAVDIEPEMVKQTRSRLADEGDRLDVLRGDVAEVAAAFDDCSVDVFASAFTLHHIEKGRREQLFGEIFRILSPGGLFVNADKIARDDDELHKRDLREQLDAFQVFDSVRREGLRQAWSAHYLEDDRTRLDEGAHKRLLTTSGFVAVSCPWRERMEAIIVARKP